MTSEEIEKELEGMTREQLHQHCLWQRRLIEMALRRSVRYRRRPTSAWSWVSDVFDIGSTSAIALCRSFDINPETGKDTSKAATPLPTV